jgi:LysR family transcriptional regulator, transcription activator of glutamate synthase operon
MDMLQLRYFRAVARAEHMTKAAEELGITQPSLSKIIGRLEQELGVPLFDRQRRSIRLNKFGAAFLAHVERVCRVLEDGQRQVRDMAGLEQGEISLAAASLFWIPDLLQRFRARYPSVRFQLVQRPIADLVDRLETGASDFCFQSIPLTKAGIQWTTLLTDDIVLVVSGAHRLAGRGCIPLSAVADEAVVIEQVGSGLRDVVDYWCRRAAFTPRIVCEINEPAALLAFVKADVGVGFAPALMKKQIAAQGLKVVRLTDPKCQRTFGMAWHKERYLSRAARTFRQFTTAYFADLRKERW